MTTLLAERAPRLDGLEPHAGGPTLERVISGVWDELSRDQVAVCPVCAGEMSRPLGETTYGICSGCGSELS